MDKRKSIKLAALAVCLVLAVALILIGVVMISGRPQHGPGSDTSAGTTVGTEGNNTETSGEYGNMSESEIKTDPPSGTALISDRLEIGDGNSEKEHSLVLTGKASSRSAVTKTGTLEKGYSVISFEGKGSTAEWTMAPGRSEKDDYVLFEVSEVHQANLESFAYTVFVDGKEVYYRTYEQISSSPNHYFFAVLNSEISDPGNVKLKIVSDTDNVFSIYEVAAYADFFEKAKDQGVDGKLMFYLHSSESTDLAQTHINDFSGASYDNFDLGLMFKLSYFGLSNSEILEKLTGMISLASENKLPLQLMPSLSWGAPYDITDGRGGSFSDVKYGQVLYNSRTGEWVDSTPNAYGSTPWESWGEPTLLGAQKTRISDMWRYVTGYLNNSIASGNYALGVNTLIEHSVVFKGPLPQASFYTMGVIDGGDFNAAVIAAAKADGVALDPTDGLSYEEKKWMNEYQARYVQSLADTYQAAYGTDPIVVDNGKVTYPSSQMMNNIFSHTVQWVDQTPSHGDLRISGWKSGIGTGFYEASEEFALIDDIRFYQYRVAYGKTGNCNFEMSSLNASDVFANSVSKLYEAGVDFITLFNDERSYRTASKLAALDRDLPGEKATAPVHYDESLLWVDYNRDIAEKDLLTEKFGVIDHKNVRTDLSDGTLLPASNGEGYVVYRVSSDEKWDNGIYVDLEAYSLGTNRIKIYAGPDEASLGLVATFRYDRSQSNSFNRYSVERYDLTKETKGRDGYLIKISFEGSEASATLVKAVKVCRAYSDTTGQKNGVTFTKLQARVMNLWTAKREEANRLIDAYVEKKGSEDGVSAEASALNEKGLPSDALRLVSREISRLLPANFAIKGGGRLGDLPVSVKLSRNSFTGSVTIKSLTSDSAAFSVFSTYQYSEQSRVMDVTFTSLEKGKYVLTNVGWNEYSLNKSPDGDLETASDGSLTVRVTAEFERKLSVSEVEGRVKSYSNGVIRLIVQDPAVSRYFPIDVMAGGDQSIFKRRADGSGETANQGPVAGDYAKLSFDENGKLVSCESVYGVKTGVIKSFTPPDLKKPDTTNGLIEFEDGAVFEIEYQAYTTEISLDGNEKVRARALTDAQLCSLFRSGRKITITYCPEFYGEYQRILTVKEG
ncbi:MAG: hypothetical protein J6Z80_02445 [Clostridia bacterium]|nr:hypothetical protein [Clostridia bacterium]